MSLHDQLDALLGIQDTDDYGKLRDRLVHQDDSLLEALVAMRKDKRLTQDQVAERMGRSKTAVSNFERLGSDPHLSTIRRYAAAVGALITHRVEDYDDCRADLNGPLTVTVRSSAMRQSTAIAVEAIYEPVEWSSLTPIRGMVSYA
jgi:transcriptional regulator with XRE-family HTH domain